MSLNVFSQGSKVPVNTFLFPGGEVGVKVDLYGYKNVRIQAYLKNSNDIMELLMLTDAIRRSCPGTIIDLEMPYVPYARQDRVMVPGESLSIKVFCDLINSQKYNSVTIWDPHSEVTPALLDNCKTFSQAQILREGLPFGKEFQDGVQNVGLRSEACRKFMHSTVLVAPDAGAMKKIGEVTKLIGFKNIVRADKVRDPATGKILETVVYSDHIGDKNFVIIDDICDGGRTFIELAKVLRPLTNGKIILYVTHGIFSAGLEVFSGVIDEVYTANSFLDERCYVNVLAA